MLYAGIKAPVSSPSNLSLEQIQLNQKYIEILESREDVYQGLLNLMRLPGYPITHRVFFEALFTVFMSIPEDRRVMPRANITDDEARYLLIYMADIHVLLYRNLGAGASVGQLITLIEQVARNINQSGVGEQFQHPEYPEYGEIHLWRISNLFASYASELNISPKFVQKLIGFVRYDTPKSVLAYNKDTEIKEDLRTLFRTSINTLVVPEATNLERLILTIESEVDNLSIVAEALGDLVELLDNIIRILSDPNGSFVINADQDHFILGSMTDMRDRLQLNLSHILDNLGKPSDLKYNICKLKQILRIPDRGAVSVVA